MPIFYYEGRNKRGEKSSGIIKAKDERDLAWQLKSEGLIPTKIEKKKEKEKGSFSISILNRVSLVEKLMFTRHLSVMIKGGVALPEAVQTLGRQTKSAYFKKVLEGVSENLKKGINLHEALAAYPRVFTSIYVNMVEVGEILGNLEEILNLLAVQLKKEHDIKSKVKGAMMYPLVVLSATIAIGILMMVVVIPRIAKIFKELKANLPASTRFVIALSEFIKNHTLLVIFMIVFSVVGFVLFSKSAFGKKVIDFILIKTPFIKDIVIKVNSARFCRSLSSMLGGGVSIVRSLEIVAESAGNTYYERATKEAAKEVQKGVSLNSVLERNPDIFPILLVQMMRVGEETGMSAQILKQLAEFYEEEVDSVTRSLSSIVEPVLMIILGAAVGFFAVSMLQPMYSVVDYIG